MTFCDFHPLTDNPKPRWECSVCKHVTPLSFAKPPRRKCPESHEATNSPLLDGLLRSEHHGCKGCKDKPVSPISLDKTYREVINGTGPGSQLWRLFSRLGIQHTPDCSCLLLADIMNDLGPQGCREQKDNLLKLMRKNQKKYGWSSYLKAGANMVILGWVFKLNPLDPLPGLLDKAIELAEQA